MEEGEGAEGGEGSAQLGWIARQTAVHLTGDGKDRGEVRSAIEHAGKHFEGCIAGGGEVAFGEVEVVEEQDGDAVGEGRCGYRDGECGVGAFVAGEATEAELVMLDGVAGSERVVDREAGEGTRLVVVDLEVVSGEAGNGVAMGVWTVTGTRMRSTLMRSVGSG